MKIVIIGGTGLIGRQVAAKLQPLGHEVVAASPSSGVNALTGEGLAAALEGAQVVVDVANSPSFEDAAVLRFFETSSRNLLAAEAAAGVRHHVALSIVGTDRPNAPGYFRGKLAQERLIEASPAPYTIVRATQFFEFIGAIANADVTDGVIRLSSGDMQPMASADVAQALVDVALGAPVKGVVEIAGPERAPFARFVGAWLAHNHDPRTIAADPAAPYFGAPVYDGLLTPGPGARIMPTRYDDWLARSAPKAVAT